ncbi:MAG TPA: CaiB/BaiF CoA-transferase family protein [Myxococcota bacterium]|nr:CaiB/BaiF CoA-transferase family protein [Myxococcota bacterium]
MGPLQGIRLLEVAGIGPGPYCAMVLADMGAEVVRIVRPGPGAFGERPSHDLLSRGRRSICVDLKRPEGANTVLRLCERADGLFEGFRPGVMERLGLGPEACLARNPRLVYGRMTGFGQDGPLAGAAGHDINYIALSGVLAHIARLGQPPTPPINLIGDFGGGGLLLAFGMVCALLERVRSGKGQVVDAAMVDGAAALMTIFHGAQQSGFWSETPGTNMLDSGAPYYDAYETADGRYVAIGAIEPQFWAELVAKLGLDGEDLPAQNDRSRWPALRERLAALFRTRTRDAWCEILEGSDACFAPVLTMTEARTHPHARARDAFIEVAGVAQPRPAPRFSRTDSGVQSAPVAGGANTDEVLREWGFPESEIAQLRDAKAIA